MRRDSRATKSAALPHPLRAGSYGIACSPISAHAPPPNSTSGRPIGRPQLLIAAARTCHAGVDQKA